MDEKAVWCPNCGTHLKGKPDEKIVCDTCGGSFTFVAGEAKLTGVGEFDQLKTKVGELEAGQAELRQQLGQPAQPPADPQQEPPVTEDDEDEEDL